MLTLESGQTLRAVAGTAAVIDYTVQGDVVSTSDSFGLSGIQGSLPNTLTTLYTSSSVQTLINEIDLVNTSGSNVPVTFYQGARRIGQITVPANGSASYGRDGWWTYDSTGVRQYVGSTGPSGTIAVGTVTTLAPGSAVTVTNVGTPTAATFNFGIPAGAVFRSGSGVPSNAVGLDGDVYLRTNATGDLYQRSGGVYSILMSLVGPAGAAATVAVGTTTTLAPGSSASVNNSGSSSAAVFNFSIPAGAVWRNGSAAPSNAVGLDGDYYLRTNGDIYVRSGGVYSVLFNIIAGVASISAGSSKITIGGTASAPTVDVSASYDSTLVHTTGNETIAGVKQFGDASTPAWFYGGIKLMPQSIAYNNGLLYHDTTNKCPVFYNSDSNLALNIGQEDWIQVRNVSGATINNGQVVYISGSNTGMPTIALAKADSYPTSVLVAVATETIANNSTGFVTKFGIVNNLDTSGYAPGTVLYLSATTAGALTASFPSGSNIPVIIGTVVTVNATTGNIMVQPQLPPTLASASGMGWQSAADKSRQDNLAARQVNIMDFGGNSSGAANNDTALANAIAALGAAGGVVIFPGGTFNFGAAVTISANNVVLDGISANGTILKWTITTGDCLTISGYGSGVRDLQVQAAGSSTTNSKTAGYSLNLTGTETFCYNCNFQYGWNVVGLNGPLSEIDDCWFRYFGNTGIIVNQNSDHRVTRCSMDNAVGTLPATAGIDVQLTASLLIANCNIIHSNFALNLSPATGVTVPSVKVINSFFDSSAVGLRIAGAGSVFRCQFTNCWFSSMSTAGILIAPSTAGNNADGLTFTNCDILNNVAGTTTGVSVTTGNAGKIKFIACNIAGWTTGVSVVGGSNFFPIFQGCTIGSVSAFGVNTTGVTIATGTYKGLVLQGNDCRDNTTVLSLGTVTVSNWSDYRIIDNPGINPRGAITPPIATPAINTAYTNTSGFRVQVLAKNNATTVPTWTINGQSAGTSTANTLQTFILEPGQTIQVTTALAANWAWVGM